MPLGSKNYFFTGQNYTEMQIARNILMNALDCKERSISHIEEYLEAFDFFATQGNGNKFDGRTLLKDLPDIRIGRFYLDADAMLHDYEYIMGANRNMRKKLKSDWKYVKNMERNSKGSIRVVTLLLLFIITPFYVPYNIYKNRK